MEFDFSAFAKNESKIEEIANIKQEIEKKDSNANTSVIVEKEVKKEEVVEVKPITKTVSKDLTMDEKLDMWIKEYEGQPKIVYSSLRLYCTFEDSTEVMTVLDKTTNSSYEIPGRDKFEDIVFNSVSRPDREKKILKYLEDIHSVKLKSTPSDEEELTRGIEQNVEEEIEKVDTDTVEEFVIPEDVI